MTATENFIEQLYTQLFGRTPDPEGKQSWADVIDSGTMNAAEVTEQLIQSQEFSSTLLPLIQLYQSTFGRTPDVEGLHAWAAVVRDGASLETLSQSFLDSDEYQSLYPDTSDNNAFLDQLYLNAFGRAADAEGKQHWLDQLDSGSQSRADVLLAFSTSTEMSVYQGEKPTLIAEEAATLGTITDDYSVQTGTTGVQQITRLYAGDDYQGVPVPGLSKEGVVVDGYIAGATVTLTVTETVDGVVQTRTETRITDESGNFDFGEDAGFGRLQVSDGTDISTGAAVEGVMSAPAGASVINPLTTLIDQLVQNGSSTTAADATQLVSTKLGLNSSIDLLNFDPVNEVLNPNASSSEVEAALQVQVAAAQTNTLLTQVAALLDGAGAVSDEKLGSEAATKALADIFSNPELDTIDLAETSTISQLTTTAAENSGADDTVLASVGTLVEDSSSSIAQLNNAIVDASSGNSQDALANIAQVQVVAEKLEEQLESGAEQNDLSGVLDATETSALQDAIDAEEDNVSVGDGTGAIYQPDIPDVSTPTAPAADRQGPVIQSVSVNASGHIEVVYNESIATSTPVASSFNVTVDNVASYLITDLNVSGNTLTLIPGTLLNSSNVVNSLSYTPPSDTNSAVSDALGNTSLTGNSTSIVNNSAIDPNVPVITSITVNGSGDLEIQFSSNIDGSTVEVGDFNVTVDGNSNHALTSGSIVGNTLTLVATNKISSGSTVNSVSYDPAQGTADSIVGQNMLAALTQTLDAITNNGPDLTAPTLSSVSISSDNADTAHATTGDTITLTFTADEALNGLPTVTIAGNSVTPSNTSGNSYAATYTMQAGDAEGSVGFTVDFIDSAGNAGTQVTTTTDSSSIAFDRTAPTLSSSTPADDSDSFSATADIALTFNETVKVGSGSIKILLASDDSLVESIDISSNQVSFNGSTVTVNPSNDLLGGESYYLEIDSTAIKNSSGINYAGLSTSTELNFTAAPITLTYNDASDLALITGTDLSTQKYILNFDLGGASFKDGFTDSNQNLITSLDLTGFGKDDVIRFHKDDGVVNSGNVDWSTTTTTTKSITDPTSTTFIEWYDVSSRLSAAVTDNNKDRVLYTVKNNGDVELSMRSRVNSGPTVSININGMPSYLQASNFEFV